MPPKRKAASSTGGFAKKSKSTGSAKLKYGGTGKKNADKYGAKGIDWDAAVKLAEKAAKKEINKNIETQYSMAMVSMTHEPTVTANVGWNLHGLNRTVGDQDGYSSAGAMIYNLGFLSKPGGTISSGYRLGQRINAKHFRIVISANLPMVSADCTYHWRIVRRKNDASGHKAYELPTLTETGVLGLFKPLEGGPHATNASYGEQSNSTVPFAHFASAMRQNTEQWTFCKGGHGYKYVKANPIDIDTNDDKYVASFCETLYFPLEEEWEFVSRDGSDIKGGNYFFVMWREGGNDLVQYSTSPSIAAALGKIQIKVMFELAFKDGG